MLANNRACPQGTYHDAAKATCVTCEINYYNPWPNATKCLPCPSQTESVANRTLCRQCPPLVNLTYAQYSAMAGCDTVECKPGSYQV